MSMASGKEAKKRHVFTWKVKNFSLCSESTGQSLSSPPFKATSLDETSWFIKLYPRGRGSESCIICVLCRVHEDAGPTKIQCECLIEMLNGNNEILQSKNKQHVVEKGSECMSIIYRSQLINSKPREDALVVRCQLSADLPGKVLCSQNSCTTTIKQKKCSFQWDINNLNTYPFQKSFKFSNSESLNLDITVKIPDDDVKIYIRLETNLPSSIVICNCVLIDNKGKEGYSKQATKLLNPTDVWEFPTFFKKSQLNADRDIYLKDDCFAMRCDFTISGYIVELREEHPFTVKYSIAGRDATAILSEDIRRLHSDSILTYVKLKVDEQTFAAHKCILSARSPVFCAMFNQDMMESQKGEVDIPDFGAETVNLFLEYIYTGTVKELDYENMIKLIVAADKYQVLSLKEKCAELLASVLSDANVCEILVVADLVQNDGLKASVFNYIKKKPKMIFNSNEWKQLAENNLLLATETASSVAILLEDQAKE